MSKTVAGTIFANEDTTAKTFETEYSFKMAVHVTFLHVGLLSVLLN